MARVIPPTRFPDSVAVSYSHSINKLISELGKVTLSVYDEQITPQIKLQKSRDDGSSYKLDAPLDIIQRAVDVIKGLSIGIFNSSVVQETAGKFVNSLNLFNKNNISNQGKVKGIDPSVSEPWLESFMKTSISENASYITNIKDGYLANIESIIYQGVKNGSSAKKVRDQLVERVGMSRKRAGFIAVDQTGSILGQMTAKRHKQMGVSKFKWLTSNDEKVRKTHRDLSNKVFSYTDPPSVGLPGEDYRCRCVAIPVLDDKEKNSKKGS